MKITFQREPIADQSAENRTGGMRRKKGTGVGARKW